MWTGTLSFGLVAIPVGLHGATREHELEFHQFEAGTSDRIRYKRVNERTGEEVPFERIVKGVDVGGGELVMVDRDELEQVAPGRSRLLSIEKFVELAEIDPVFFQKTYYLGPSGDTAAKPYRLLVEALTRTGQAAVASFVMREKEYLAAIRVDGPVLALSTLYFGDEVRDPAAELGELPEAEIAGKEVDMAVALIESLSDRWDPNEFRDTYTERVRDLIESKRTGGEVIAAPEAPEATEVIDLMEVLRRSVEQAGAKRRAEPLKDAGTAAADKPASGEADDDLANRTKADLDKLAREFDIKGRSSMTKDDLLAAIRRFERAERRAS
jgi:DNA end-binding protein Ku